MRIILLLINLLSFTFVYSQRTPFSDVEVNDNGYTLNGTPYTGNIYELYKSGQLKSEYEVRDGQKHGTENIYFIDNSFGLSQYANLLVKEKYKDTLLIQKLDTDLENLNQDISLLQKDSSYEYKIWNNLKYNEIGIKKFYKYKEKYEESKLKNDKLVLYEKYLTSENKYDGFTYQLKQKRTDKLDVIRKVRDEKNKPIYRNKREESYTYLNGSKTGIHNEFDKDENLVVEEILKDGVRNGSYKRYENGKIKEEITYLNGKKEGLYTVHNNNYRDVTTYSNGLKNGLYKKYKGDVVTIYGTYSNDLIEGEWKEFDDSGNITLESAYLNDTLNGVYKKYNGEVVIKEGQYTSGLMNGEWIFRHNNGNITLESAYLNDTLNGVYKKYNGEVVIKEGQYTSGLMNGEWIFRHNNGNIKGEGKYVDGDGGNVGSTGMPINGREGEWVFYHENGNKLSSYNYSNGKREGEYLSYYEEGSLKVKLTYKNDSVDFEGNRETDYNEDGSVKSRWDYSNGEWKKYLTPEEEEALMKELIENMKSLNSALENLNNSSSGDDTYDYSSPNSCSSCQGTGKCPECSKPQRVHYWRNGWQDDNETRLGKTVCTDCRGDGKVKEHISNGKMDGSENCYASSCNNGWRKCRKCYGDGECNRCHGKGTRD